MRPPQRSAVLLLLLFLMATASGAVQPTSESEKVDAELLEPVVERLHFSIENNSIHDARGMMVESWEEPVIDRPEIADSRLGFFTTSGVVLRSDLPQWSLETRSDLSLVLVERSTALEVARAALDEIPGLAVRDLISPSGFIVQGTTLAQAQAGLLTEVVAIHQVPLAMVVDDSLLQLDENHVVEVRVEAWRNDRTEKIDDSFQLWDVSGGGIGGDIGYISRQHLQDAHLRDEGRWQGLLSGDDLMALSRDPSVSWIREPPVFGIWNDQSRSHMKSGTMSTWFTSNLDGSGEIVAVADTGIDHDHGDFGSRVNQKVDLVGDGSTADTDSGHGTHVACTVLGDGSRGGYEGVVPQAELYFQAMEHDASGNMYSVSINSLLNAGYDNGARTHTNSWGSQSSSDFGRYTTDSEDVDDRTNHYDRYYSGYQGLTVLFANGNDGPNSGTVGAPATAKNAISIGMHQARYSGAPDNIMQGSSRGPTDDGRIKPDLLAPGGYVRSCRAQEAQDISGSSWSNQWYLEYTGTSMATPNAAGAAAMVREYLTEIAQRQQPQGALVKSLLILGAEDVGSSRDIPNNDEGWGRINLRNTLAPNAGRGIWVDDRSTLSTTGSVKTYSFNITSSNLAFKTSLVWSDERGSRFNNGAQLKTDLNLEVIAPDGTVYRGNDFQNGRSTTGGSWDDLNNVEVTLIDQAQSGIWTVKVRDHSHGGSRSQPYALSVSGVGVNDLRPDPAPVVNSIMSDVEIPQVGDEVTIFAAVQNFGNVEVDDLDVVAYADSNQLGTYQIDLGPGESKSLSWQWTPDQSGIRTIAIEVDPNDNLDEIEENNNWITSNIEVTAPGVKVESTSQTVIVDQPGIGLSTWQVQLTNTALLETNASLSHDTVYRQQDGTLFSDWFIGSGGSNFSLDGKDSATVNISLVHPSPPDPGTYVIPLTGLDVDNGITYPYSLYLEVPEIPDLKMEADSSIIIVSPLSDTSFNVDAENRGNSDSGWNLFITPPAGWQAGFDDLGSRPGAPSGSTGAIPQGGDRQIGITVIPPQIMVAAGSEMQLDILAISQSNNSRTWEKSIDLVVETIENVSISLEGSMGLLRPDSVIDLQFLVENTGNTNLSLTPSANLPGGWSVTSALQTMTVEAGGSSNWVITIEGNGNAVGGDYSIHLSGESGRFSHEGVLEVQAIPKPTVEFSSIEIDGKTWDHPLGPGSHPIEKPFNLTWIMINEGEGGWEPNVELQTDTDVIGDCGEVGLLKPEEVKELTCSILLKSSLEPGSQPKVTLRLDDGIISRQNVVSLYVEEIRTVVWTDVKLPVLETGEESIIELRVGNDGNMPMSHRVALDERPSGWSASIEGSGLVQLEPGEEQTIRIRATANQPGKEAFTIRLSDADSVSGSSHEFTLEAEGQVISSSSSGGSPVITWISIIVIIAGLGACAYILVNRRESTTPAAGGLARPLNPPSPEAFVPPQAVVASAQPLPVVKQDVQCWACMKVIGQENMLACPGCGARYHTAEVGCGVANLQACRGCNTPAGDFIQS